MDQEHIPVDEVALHECLDELAAAHNHDVLILTQLRLETGHRLRHITFKKGRVDPRQRLFERRGGNILLNAIEPRGERVVVGSAVPGRKEIFVCQAPKQQGIDVGFTLSGRQHCGIAA